MSLSTWMVWDGTPGVGSTTGTRPLARAICAAMTLSFMNVYCVGLGCAWRIR